VSRSPDLGYSARCPLGKSDRYVSKYVCYGPITVDASQATKSNTAQISKVAFLEVTAPEA
jgi:hypothetical protein